MGAGVEWSHNEDAELSRLWGEGRVASEIAPLLGRTRNAVIGRAHRLGLSSRPSPIKYVDDLTFKARLERRRLQQRARRAKAVKPMKVLKFKKPKGLPMWNTLPLSPTRTCQYIEGDPKVDPTMCGKPAIEDRPYCPEHCAICYELSKAERAEAA